MLEAEYVELAQVQETFRVGERDVLTVLRGLRVEMLEQLMHRLADGIEARNLRSLRGLKFKGGRRAEADLRKVLRGIGRRGIEHAGDELERQGQ